MLFLNKRGQTITEMLVAFTIAAVVSALSAVIVAKSLHSYKIIKAEDEIMKVGELMVYAIFEGDAEGILEANSIVSISASEIIYSDKNGITRRIFLDSSAIKKDLNTPLDTTDDFDLDINDTVNVTGFTVSGYNYTETSASGSTVQRVHIQIALTAKEGTDRARTITLDSSQKLRRVCNL